MLVFCTIKKLSYLHLLCPCTIAVVPSSRVIVCPSRNFPSTNMFVKVCENLIFYNNHKFVALQIQDSPYTKKFICIHVLARELNTDQLRYLEIKGNGKNTSSFPKFEIRKSSPKSSTLLHSQTKWFSFHYPPCLLHR